MEPLHACAIAVRVSGQPLRCTSSQRSVLTIHGVFVCQSGVGIAACPPWGGARDHRRGGVPCLGVRRRDHCRARWAQEAIALEEVARAEARSAQEGAQAAADFAARPAALPHVAEGEGIAVSPAACTLSQSMRVLRRVTRPQGIRCRWPSASPAQSVEEKCGSQSMGHCNARDLGSRKLENLGRTPTGTTTSRQRQAPSCPGLSARQVEV